MMQELEQMGLAYIVLIREQLKLFALEVKLAQMSVVPALLCASMLLLLCFSVWICALVLAGYGLYYYTDSIWISLISLFVINLGLLLTIGILLKQYLQRMSFQYTRAQLNEYKQLKQSDPTIG